jgi:hypothetical protein
LNICKYKDTDFKCYCLGYISSSMHAPWVRLTSGDETS